LRYVERVFARSTSPTKTMRRIGLTEGAGGERVAGRAVRLAEKNRQQIAGATVAVRIERRGE
jgi:hypothetical protein